MSNLQKEIKTTKFENEHQKALVNIVFTFHWTNQKVKEYLLPFEITPQQFNVLRILRGQYPSPATVNLIKSRILDKMSDTSRIIDRLIQKGYVKKNVNNYDKRAVDIIISDKGLSLLKKMDKEVDLSKIISAGLTEEEAKTLNLILDKIRV
jgi:DNA-binding MarR family transcriptional regulator